MLSLHSKEGAERREQTSVDKEYLLKTSLTFEFSADQISMLRKGWGIVLVDVLRNQSREEFVRKN
jgi:hypothetical protein